MVCNIWGVSFTVLGLLSCCWWALIEDILLMVFVVIVLTTVVLVSMATGAGVNEMGVVWKADTNRVVGVCTCSMGVCTCSMGVCTCSMGVTAITMLASFD